MGTPRWCRTNELIRPKTENEISAGKCECEKEDTSKKKRRHLFHCILHTFLLHLSPYYVPLCPCNLNFVQFSSILFFNFLHSSFFLSLKLSVCTHNSMLSHIPAHSHLSGRLALLSILICATHTHTHKCARKFSFGW